MLRRIGAVLAGLVLVVVLSIATDTALEMTGVFPPAGKPIWSTPLLLLAAGYRSVYSIAGSWLAARLAPDRPLTHAMVLGGIGFALAIAGAIVMRGYGPAFYPWLLVVLALPCAWLGGKLHRPR